ncbi:hypothetical protein SL103_17650 [Streptomyces lydicus]|uniref:Uncharacterized protein n=1 Tax=Streptomyces lydicus TaxID=47763 RepID=A0A1D7VMU0_9ACTN|nr:hypothetical protein SL103_17650 [Streptomyces lydicus]
MTQSGSLQVRTGAPLRQQACDAVQVVQERTAGMLCLAGASGAQEGLYSGPDRRRVTVASW